MRPFRFFFAISLGIFVFFFVARFVLFALIAAAILSTLFFLFKRARYFFSNMRWESDYYDEYRRPLGYHSPKYLPQADPDDVPFYDFERSAVPEREWRTIKIQ